MWWKVVEGERKTLKEMTNDDEEVQKVSEMRKVR
jgi:hypothetical protein